MLQSTVQWNTNLYKWEAADLGDLYLHILLCTTCDLLRSSRDHTLHINDALQVEAACKWDKTETTTQNKQPHTTRTVQRKCK